MEPVKVLGSVEPGKAVNFVALHPKSFWEKLWEAIETPVKVGFGIFLGYVGALVVTGCF